MTEEFRVAREPWINELEMVSPGLSARNVVEQSGCFIFDKKRLWTYNDETACSIRTAVHITGAVQADPLKAVLHKLKEETLMVSLSDSHLLIKGKGQKLGVRMEHKIESPISEMETPGEWKPLPEGFGQAVELVEGCAGKDEQQWELTCVHLTPNFIEAYDNYQFARFRIKFPLESNTLIKQVALRNIIQRNMIEFAESEHWLHFRNAEKLVLSCRRWVGDFGDHDHIAGVKGQKIDLPKSITEITDRAEVFSSGNTQNNHVRVELKPGWMYVEGEGQYGWYRGHRKVKYGGDPLQFMIPPKMLVELVKQHSECEICPNALKAEIGRFVFVTSLAVPKQEEIEEKTKVIKKKKTVKKKVKK